MALRLSLAVFGDLPCCASVCLSVCLSGSFFLVWLGIPFVRYMVVYGSALFFSPKKLFRGELMLACGGLMQSNRQIYS